VSVAPEAVAHVDSCPDCSARLRAFSALSEWLEPGSLPEPPAGLAGRVERLRSFSRRERWSLRIWRAPLGLGAALVGLSAAILALPVLSASENASLAAALAGALRSEGQALLRWPAALWSAFPAGISALSEAVLGQRSLAAVLVLLLLPSGWALSRLIRRRGARA
jgi:hypothetical protein